MESHDECRVILFVSTEQETSMIPCHSHSPLSLITPPWHSPFHLYFASMLSLPFIITPSLHLFLFIVTLFSTLHTHSQLGPTTSTHSQLPSHISYLLRHVFSQITPNFTFFRDLVRIFTRFQVLSTTVNHLRPLICVIESPLAFPGRAAHLRDVPLIVDLLTFIFNHLTHFHLHYVFFTRLQHLLTASEHLDVLLDTFIRFQD